jgi:uncharacterized protein
MELHFEWDALKAQKVWEKHGIRFTDAMLVFAGKRTEVQSNHHGEPRWITVGEVEGRLMAVVYTRRGNTIRLISARRVRKDEKREYYSHDPRRGVE